MKNPDVQVITECGPCMGNDWRYPRKFHLNQPSKHHVWKGTRPWNQRYHKQETYKITTPKATYSYLTKLLDFLKHVFFIEEEEESEKEEHVSTISEDKNC